VREDHRTDLSVNSALRGVQLLPLPLIVFFDLHLIGPVALASSVGQGLSASTKLPAKFGHSLSRKIAIFCMDIKSIEKYILDSTLRRPKTGVQALSSRSTLPR
jgi:hypothetical protein